VEAQFLLEVALELRTAEERTQARRHLADGRPRPHAVSMIRAIPAVMRAQ
jgi:hypothetical protein